MDILIITSLFEFLIHSRLNNLSINDKYNDDITFITLLCTKLIRFCEELTTDLDIRARFLVV